MHDHLEHIREKLAQRVEENALRSLRIRQTSSIDFCSNDYLGLSMCKEIHRIESDVFGSTGSRLISGNHPQFEATEQHLATYYSAESALLFNSGYDANLGFFATVPDRGDTIIYDELVHASIRDGIRLSFANSYSFEHNNTVDLREKIAKAKGHVYVVVESVYSMDGDEAPLAEISDICETNRVALVVDEAHAIGTIGSGKGLVIEQGLIAKVFARIVTFGKAMGAHGAAVLGRHDLRTFLINYCRSFIYTTAMPIHGVQVIEKAHAYLQNNLSLIQELNARIACFKEELNGSNLDVISSNGPIQCLIIPGNDHVKSVAEGLQKKGFDVRPILSPTVTQGKERLRICLHTFNTHQEIKTLISTLRELV